MKKYIDFIFKNKKILFIGFIILNLISLYGVFQVKLNTDFSLFTTNSSIYEEKLQEMNETFGSLDQIVVMIEHDTFTNQIKDDFVDIQSSMNKIKNVQFIEGVAPEVIKLGAQDISTKQVDASVLENYYINNLAEFSPIKIVDGVYYSVFTLIINDDFSRKDIKELESILDDSGYKYYISGDQYNQFKIVDYILSILIFLPPLTILIILLVFRAQIGAFKPTLLSVLPASMASLWTFGIIGYIGNEISILTAIVPIFIIVIGSADGLHFITHYQESIKLGISRKEAMVKTLKVVGIPMIITTLTSMGGFLSLLSMKTESIIDLSLFSTLGIFLAGIASWYVLPLILSNNIDVLPKTKQKKKKINIENGIRKLWGLPSLIIIAVMLSLSMYFIPNINNEFNMLSIYKNYTLVSKNAEKVQEITGGSIPLYIEIQPKEGVLTIDSLEEVDNFVNDLNGMDQINHVINPYKFLEIVYKSQTTNELDNSLALQTTYSMISQNSNTIITNMFNTNENKVRLVVFPKDMKNDTLGSIETKAENEKSFASSVTGVQYLLRELNINISSMQLNSILLALSIVFIMLWISLRSFKIAFLSTLPIIITVFVIYGMMGLTGIPLNITTVIIFSISIGVGIDYAVHYSSVYKMYLNEGKTSKESALLAFNNVSKPIITNALGISVGLTVLIFSPLKIHLNVSILMWLSMITSVFVTLTFLPYIFRLKKS